MSELTKSVDDFVTDSYLVFGRYSNLNRHIPNALDGLKPVYRRTILSALDMPAGKMAKTATIVGNTIGRYHPHGDKSVVPVVSNLVRLGIFQGQGNHGFSQILGGEQKPSAPRYTEAMIAPNIRNSIEKLLPLVSSHPNDLGNMEYDYIPTPVPFALITGSLGIGIGSGTKVPIFTAKSLVDAYRENNPLLLESGYGLKIDKTNSSLNRLWTTGTGRLYLSMEVNKVPRGAEIVGKADIFIPDLSKFNYFKNSGKIIVKDLSTDVSRVSITIHPRISVVNQQFIYDELVKAARFEESYYMRAHYNGVVHPISIYDWIKITMTNYKKLMSKYVENNIAKINFDKLIYSNMRKVGKELMTTDKSNQDIASELNVPVEVVNDISKRSLNVIRANDHDAKLQKLDEKLKIFNNFDYEKSVDDYVSSIN